MNNINYLKDCLNAGEKSEDFVKSVLHRSTDFFKSLNNAVDFFDRSSQLLKDENELNPDNDQKNRGNGKNNGEKQLGGIHKINSCLPAGRSNF